MTLDLVRILRYDTKSASKKGKGHKLDLIKIKTFYASKDTIQKIDR